MSDHDEHAAKHPRLLELEGMVRDGTITRRTLISRSFSVASVTT